MEGELLPTESNMSGLIVPMPTLPRKVVQRVRVRGVEAIREIARFETVVGVGKVR